ncbi:30S ribosomal protein S4 [Candidatus Pacearchaeota archaeon]|nr:30S ribosomal protein S4 [Candidatus Pacearchaeota archaeon]
MPIRKHKNYSRPKKLYDLATIKDEQGLIKKYGLKTRREVWKADRAISTIRNIAKSLITANEEEKQKFVERQVKKGFNVESIADVLALGKEDLLKRRLQSVLIAKKLAPTYKHARQLIAHKHVLINNKIMDSPSHLTTLEEENSIALNITLAERKVISDEEKKLLETMKLKTEEETQ